MCGAYDSVIGMDKDISINKFITQLPDRHRPVKHPKELVMGAIEVNVDLKTKEIISIDSFNKVVSNE